MNYSKNGWSFEYWQENFYKCKVPFPCLSEQEKIGNFLDSLDDKISSLENQFILTQKFKKGLLQQMFV
jgi:type I restriction enzyme, S subunit